MPKSFKDFIKFGKNYYILKTQSDDKKIYFILKEQRLNKTQPLKEIIVPNSSSKFSLEKLHKMFVGYFFSGLKKTKNVHKASEYVEENLKNEYQNIISKDVQFSNFSHPFLEEVCKNSTPYCEELLGFMLFKGKSYFECVKDKEISEQFRKTMFALHNFIESSKKAIKNIAGEIQSVSFTLDDKLIVYYREKNTVLIFICEYKKLGPQLKAAEKLKNEILNAIKS